MHSRTSSLQMTNEQIRSCLLYTQCTNELPTKSQWRAVRAPMRNCRRRHRHAARPVGAVPQPVPKVDILAEARGHGAGALQCRVLRDQIVEASYQHTAGKQPTQGYTVDTEKAKGGFRTDSGQQIDIMAHQIPTCPLRLSVLVLIFSSLSS